jgi:histidine triad (HIT) family protein
VTCIFCQILLGELPGTFVYRGQTCAAFMDTQPINPGHVLIVPTRHAADFAALDASSLVELIQVARRITAALRGGSLRCDGVNLFLADGEAAGQEIAHVHLHVFPRIKDDGFRLRFGPQYTRPPAREALEAAAAQIRAGLDALC